MHPGAAGATRACTRLTVGGLRRTRQLDTQRRRRRRQRTLCTAPPPPAAAALVQAPVPMRVAHLPGRGRGLVATRAIARGEVVLEEAPLASVPATARPDAAPWAALGPGPAALDSEWAAMRGQQFPRLCLRVVNLLLARPALWHDQLRHLCFPTMDDGGWPEEWAADFHRARDALHTAAAAADAAGNGTATGAEGRPGLALSAAVEQFDAMFAPEVWGTLMGMAHLNSFRLHCPTVEDPAAESTCLFVQASFFNHDCHPSVEVLAPKIPLATDRPDEQGQAPFQFRAVSDVAEGAELCISYVGEAAQDDPERRAEQLELLSWGYGIDMPNPSAD